MGLEDLRVLLVDDNELTRRMIERVLRAFGCTQICLASDGTEALETARMHFRPNLIITDWNMKPMNGLTFVHTLPVTRPSSANITAMMVSARTGEAAVRTALDAGVDHFLSKPIDPTALYNALSLATGKMGLGQASVLPNAVAHP